MDLVTNPSRGPAAPTVTLHPPSVTLAPEELQEFLVVHERITSAVLRGRTKLVGRQHDVEWRVVRGQLLIQYTTPDGIEIESRQELTTHSLRWKKIRPYVIFAAVFASVLIVLVYGQSILDALSDVVVRIAAIFERLWQRAA